MELIHIAMHDINDFQQLHDIHIVAQKPKLMSIADQHAYQEHATIIN